MATSESFKTRVRVAGSGFTIFTFGGQAITFCQQVATTSPQPVGNGMSAVHPMDEPYPVEIITPAAAGPGQLVLNMFELFGSGGAASKVWSRLGASIPGASEQSPFGTFSSENPTKTTSTGFETGSDGIFNGAVDIVDVFIRQAKVDPAKMNIVKYIRPLGAGGTSQPTFYTEEYHGCVITNVIDGEQVEVGTLEIIKQITVAYRYATINGKPSAGFALRDGQTV
jgi:hypothetical protein